MYILLYSKQVPIWYSLLTINIVYLLGTLKLQFQTLYIKIAHFVQI